MYTIATLNKISPIGLNRFTDQYSISDSEEALNQASGIMVRSQNMLDMDFSPNLLAIARAGAGVNNIPLDKCADEGIVVFNTPGANANSVKELVIASLIIAARNIDSGISWVQSVASDPQVEDVSKTVEKGKGQFAGNEIAGKTLGVMGLGAIGAMVANSALALGMKVVGYDPYLTPAAAARLQPEVRTVATPEEMLPECDFITLHLPALDSTKGMVNQEFISHFKPGAILLNFSRDKLVDETSILSALESGKLKKYITDFITSGIAGKPGVTCMPHLGASTEEAEDNCAVMAAEELMSYIEKGTIKNSVNFPNVSLDAANCNASGNTANCNSADGNAANCNAANCAEGCTRLAILTKGIDDPVKFATDMLSGMASDMQSSLRILAAAGGTRSQYGYALLAVEGDLESLPEAEGIIRTRIIK